MRRHLTKQARELRRSSTDTEARLWNVLRTRQLEGVKFRRQEPIEDFIVDFVSYEKRVVIEIGGGSIAWTVHRTSIVTRSSEKTASSFYAFGTTRSSATWMGYWKSYGQRALKNPPHPDPLPPGERGWKVALFRVAGLAVGDLRCGNQEADYGTIVKCPYHHDRSSFAGGAS
jgi:hypothetical protein